MWRTLIQRFSEDEVTIDEDRNISPMKIDGQNHLIFQEHQLKYCQCVDQIGESRKYWTGDAGTECARPLVEIESERLPCSRAFECTQSGYHITILKNGESEREAHKNEYLGDVSIFDKE